MDSRLRLTIAMTIALSLAFASGLAAQSYVISELAPVSSFGARAWELNEAGTAVGHGLSPTLQQHALVWPGAGGPTTDLTPTNPLAEAQGLSNGGIVAGWARNAGGATEAARWVGGQIGFLGWLHGHIGSLAQDCNDSGLVCGWSVTNVGDPVAGVWIDGRIEAINVAQSWAFAVSETGDVVGRRWAGVDIQAFRWRAGDLVVLPDLGPNNAQAVGISPNGRVAGFAESPVTGRGHAVVWEPDGSLTDLGPYESPAGPASAQANDVNDAGIAVGTAYIDPVSEITYAMVWRGAGAEDLNFFIPPGSGWTLSEAQAVNDRGEIVGFGTKSGAGGVRAFRLRPDCDEDGLSDLDEIAAGTAHDANDDGLADACQHCQPSLGFGGPGSITLSICGDELTAAGSAATLALDGLPPATPIYLVLGAVNAPTPRKGGVLVPTPPLLVVPGLFAGPGVSLAFTVHGGGGAPLTLYLQAVAPAGATAQFSNAVQLEIGAP
ncbi:MAG TPA: hypothetical protein VFD43_08150 [Planctomycetota bacterium]|nr:hypothetical protein [Planctomycetota bacterium]